MAQDSAPTIETAEPPITFCDASVHRGEPGTDWLEGKLRLAYGKHREDRAFENRDLAVGELLKTVCTFVEGDKDGSCILQGRVIELEPGAKDRFGRPRTGVQRIAKHVVANAVLLVDIDNDTPLDELVERLPHDLFFVAWSTHSHLKPTISIKEAPLLKWLRDNGEPGIRVHNVTVAHCVRYLQAVKGFKEASLDGAELDGRKLVEGGAEFTVKTSNGIQRWRLMFVLKDEFSFETQGCDQADALALWTKTYAAVMEAFGLPYDTSCCDPSRLFYLPRIPAGSRARHEAHIFNGSPLDLAPFIAGANEKAEVVPDQGTSEAPTAAAAGANYSKMPGFKRFLAIGGKSFRAAACFEAHDPDGVRRRGDGEHDHECPFEGEHTKSTTDDTAFHVRDAVDGKGWGAWCMHDTCKDSRKNKNGKQDRGQFLYEWCVEKEVTIEQLLDYCSEEARAEWRSNRADSLDAMMKHFDARFAVVRIKGTARVLEIPANKASEPIQMKAGDFRLVYAPYKILIPGDDGECKEISATDHWLFGHGKRPTYLSVIFDPGAEPDADPEVWNLWRGFGVEGKPGDWSLLRQHLFDVVCRRNPYWFAWVMCWLADIVQNPAVKPGTAIVVKGLKGTGKTKVAEWISELMPHNSMSIAKQSQVLGRFNAHHAGKLLINSEEAFWAGDKAGEAALKHMITGAKQVIEGKGVDAIEVDDFVRLWMCTNADWAVPSTFDERRFAVLLASEEHRQDFTYFRAIDAQMTGGRDRSRNERAAWSGLQAMMWDLKHLRMPAWIEARSPPVTPWLAEQTEHSLSSVEAWWHSVLADGAFEADKSTNYWPEPDASESSDMAAMQAAVGITSTEPADMPGGLEVSVNEVWDSYQRWVKENKERYPATKEAMGKYLKILGVNKSRPRSDGKKGYRPYVYTFPPVQELREAFTTKYGIRFRGGDFGDDTLAGMIPDHVPEHELAAWRAYGEGTPSLP